jgi:branched-chain amino acid transport system ATP-binding protein
MLAVEQINTFYGDAQVLFDVSLEIHEGEVVALLGRNGAGKTTTIRSIMGLTAPSRGRVMFKQENIAGLPPYTIANRGVGFVPDNRRIFPTLIWRSPERAVRSARMGGLSSGSTSTSQNSKRSRSARVTCSAVASNRC